MKIKKRQEYIIDLFKEPDIQTDHTKNPEEPLTFKGVDLLNAIISCGMPDTFLSKKEQRKRSEQIKFKIQLFETYIEYDRSEHKLSFNEKRIEYLDSTEIGAINYWIGMILITILGQKKYQYEFMVHLSMIGKFSRNIDVDIATHKTITGKTVPYSPDLIAINNSTASFGVFESKGYSTYSKKNMESGFEQAKSVNTINGIIPKRKLVVMTTTRSKKWVEMIEKDPEGEGGDLEIDLNYLYLYHYLPIVEFIMELEPYEQGDYMCGEYVIDEEKYTIKLPKDLYNKLSIIVNSEYKFSTEEFNEGIQISDLIEKDQNENILYVE